MKTLDRYIIRYFLINFLILLVVFVLLFVVVDLVFNFDEFLRAGRGLVGMLRAIADYYGPMIPFLYVFFSGLLVVAAMGFTFAGLARSGELGAMVTSGISMYRIAACVVVVGFLLNALTLVDQEFVIPRLASKLTRGPSQVGSQANRPYEINYAIDGRGNLLSATQFDPHTQKLTDVTILERNAQGLAVRRITAREATWDEGRQRWNLVEGEGMLGELAGSSAASSGVRQLESVASFATDLAPLVLLAREEAVYPRLLSLADLQTLSRNPAVDTGMIRQIIWSRFSLLVMNLLILVMGLPFFLLREPANMLLQGVKAAGVCVGTWGMGLVLLQVGATTLNPVASAWLPVVLYLPLSAVLLLMVKT